MIETFSYVDDYNWQNSAGEKRRGRSIEVITAAKKARSIVTEELESNGWTRDPDKDEKIDFRVQGKAKWVGITINHELNWKVHCNEN